MSGRWGIESGSISAVRSLPGQPGFGCRNRTCRAVTVPVNHGQEHRELTG
jgi:hypothetical protein